MISLALNFWTATRGGTAVPVTAILNRSGTTILDRAGATIVARG